MLPLREGLRLSLPDCSTCHLAPGQMGLGLPKLIINPVDQLLRTNNPTKLCYGSYSIGLSYSFYFWLTNFVWFTRRFYMDHQSMIVNPQLFCDLQSEINLDRRRYLSCYNSSALLLLLFAAATGVAASLLSTAAARSLSLILFFGDSNDAAGLSSCDNALAERFAVAAQAGSSANNFGNFWSSK